MDAAALNAITDVDVLRALVRQQIDVIAQHEALIDQRDRTITFKDAKIDKLTHEIARLRRLQYAAKSGALDPAQGQLFDEAMAADIAALEAELDDLRSATLRRTPQRRALPAELERIETIHEPVSCDCAAGGQALVKSASASRRSSTANRCASSCAARCIHNTRARPARRSWRNLWRRRSWTAGFPRRGCWPR